MQKLLLRAFNSECDELINKVKYNNYDASLKRITSSKDTISKLGTIMNILISQSYYNLKIEEMKIALEYQIKKQEEKETIREAREQMREAATLERLFTDTITVQDRYRTCRTACCMAILF